MQNRRHDANTSVTGGRAAPFGPDVDIIVLTTDVDLLGILQEAAGPEHILWHAQSADAAVELLVSGRCGVLIADLQVLGGEASALLEKLQAQFPELVLLATGRRDEEHAIGPLVTSGRVYRFLHKPLSPARASVFLSTAARRYVELSNTSSPTIIAVKQLAQQRAPRVTLLSIVIGLVVLTGLWMAREPIARMVNALVAVTEPADTKPDPAIARNLAEARQAFQEGRLVAPPADNALGHYRAVLALQADNSEALTGVQRVIDALEREFNDAIGARDTPRAAQAFSTLQKADPQNRNLGKLREELLTLSRSKRQ